MKIGKFLTTSEIAQSPPGKSSRSREVAESTDERRARIVLVHILLQSIIHLFCLLNSRVKPQNNMYMHIHLYTPMPPSCYVSVSLHLYTYVQLYIGIHIPISIYLFCISHPLSFFPFLSLSPSLSLSLPLSISACIYMCVHMYAYALV